MVSERQQFRILYRDSLRRMLDVELLAAGGDPGRLLGQAAALLAAFSLAYLAITLPKYLTGSAASLAVAVRGETDFLFATTMAVSGFFAVLAWNAVLPDRRDCAVLGVLPVRLRTVFLARMAAIGTALGVVVVALNALTGLCYPFLSPGGARNLPLYWLAMIVAALFMCAAVLAVQGLAAALLDYRAFQRVSSWLQLMAFFAVLTTYFLRPPLDSGKAHWLPSFWPLTSRALWDLAMVVAVAAVTFAMAFGRNMRRILETPEITPADRSRPAARLGVWAMERLFRRPLDRAILLFTARTLVRSRQQRLLMAAYGGIGLAIALVYAKDLLYGYSGGLWDMLGSNRQANLRWDQPNAPLLAGTLVLLCFAVIGARATFSIPASLGANWIFRLTAVHAPAAYFRAVRTALYGFTALPLWLFGAAACLAAWPWMPAAEHILVLLLVGVLLVEISLHRFRKIPFACSYLPGKANVNVRLAVYSLLFLFMADQGVSLEYWAIERARRFVVFLAVLLLLAAWARWRTSEYAGAEGNRIQFDDLPPSEVFALDLRQDGAWAGDEAYVNAIDTGSGRKHVWFEQLTSEIRQSLRVFRKAPAFSAAVVFLIATGIGGNLAIYSVIHTILDKPAPGVRATGLVTVGAMIDGRIAEGGPLNSYPDYLDFAAQSRTMSSLSAEASEPFLTLTLPDGAYQVRGGMVSGNYFETLGVPVIRGRSFTEEESRGAGGLAAVIAWHVWQQQFHGAEDVIGQPIMVSGHPATVVGVAARGFYGTGLAPHFEIGLPLVAFSRLEGSERELFDRTRREVMIIGRLARGASLESARAEFGAMAHPADRRWAPVLAPYSATAFGPNSSPQARRLMAAVSLVALMALLVVSANVASLMLARSRPRQREVAIRLSMGASRGRVIAALWGEGLALSLTACLGGWVLAWWATSALEKWLPSLESGARLGIDLTPDGKVMLYSMALAVVSTLVFTLGPAAAAWRQQILPFLKAGEQSVMAGRSRFASLLLVGQLALCAALLAGAGLAYQALDGIDTQDLYFTKDHLLLAAVNTSGDVLERIRRSVGEIPGVTAVSYATAAPPHDHGWMALPVRAQSSGEEVLSDGTVVGPDYIRALGVPHLVGRDISPGLHDAAVINQKLAGALWPGQSAVGQRLLMGERRRVIEVVGVVPNGAFSGVAKDGSFAGMGKAERPNFIFLADPDGSGAKTLHIRYAGDLDRLVPEVRAAVRRVDGQVPVFSVRTMDAEFAQFTAPIRIVTMLIGFFALAALAHSAAGLYAVIAFQTTRRGREFGIRAALGATSWQILRIVLRQGLVLTGVGVAAGLAVSVAMARAASSILFGVDAAGKGTYVAAGGVLALVALVACYVPARRASRVDPIEVLRQD